MAYELVKTILVPPGSPAGYAAPIEVLEEAVALFPLGADGTENMDVPSEKLGSWLAKNFFDPIVKATTANGKSIFTDDKLKDLTTLSDAMKTALDGWSKQADPNKQKFAVQALKAFMGKIGTIDELAKINLPDANQRRTALERGSFAVMMEFAARLAEEGAPKYLATETQEETRARLKLAFASEPMFSRAGRVKDESRLNPSEPPSAYLDKKLSELPASRRKVGAEIVQDLALLEKNLKPKDRIEAMNRLAQNVKKINQDPANPADAEQKKADVARAILVEALRGPLGLQDPKLRLPKFASKDLTPDDRKEVETTASERRKTPEKDPEYYKRWRREK